MARSARMRTGSSHALARPRRLQPRLALGVCAWAPSVRVLVFLDDALSTRGRIGEDAACFGDALIGLDRFACRASLRFVRIGGAKRDLDLAMADDVAKNPVPMAFVPR